MNSDRQFIAGMDRAVPLPIPFSSMDRYARRVAIEGEDFEYFVAMIRMMDKVVLDHAREQAPSTSGQAGIPKASGREMTAEIFDAVFG